MGMQVIAQARLRRIKKFVVIGTICAHPKYNPTPFKEEELWNGYPEGTNALLWSCKKCYLFNHKLIEFNMDLIQ